MKKLIVLMVLVVAMIAAPLFAEVTQGAWKGDFTYKIGTNLSEDNLEDAVSTDLDLSMSAKVGENTTFSVGLGSTGTGSNVTVNNIKMTQDFSSLLGDGMTFKMTVGNMNLGMAEYKLLGGFNFTDSATDDSFIFTVGTAGITAKLWLAPVPLVNDDDKPFALEVQYRSDMIDGGVGFSKTAAQETGILDVGVKVKMAPLTAAVAVKADLEEDGKNKLYVAANYAMAPLTAKVALETMDLEEFADTSKAKVGVDYKVSDMVTAKVGATIPFAETADTMGADAGVEWKVDSVKYSFGVAYKTGSTYIAPYAKGTEDDPITVGFKMDVDF